MSRQIFINLPVSDVEATTAFYSALGFEFNPAFATPQSACMAISDTAFVMWLAHERFADFTDGAEVLDPRTKVTALYSFPADSREAVDATVAAAVAAGGAEHGEREDHGFMYSHAFRDLDGHGWQVMWMDAQAATEGPSASAAANG